jgi:branched-chain amino acid transport system substrate-binding protein
MRTSSRAARLSAVGISLVLFLGACGSDGDDSSSGDTTPTTADGGSTTTTAAEFTPTPAGENGGKKDGDGELVIGAVLPQSGNLSALGPPMIEGARMAVEDINEAGGINGKPVRLIVKDDGGAADDDLALTSVDELINNEKVDAIVGAAASGTTKSIIDKITAAGIVECSPSNTGSDLSTWNDKGLYFRTPPADDLQAQALAKAISDDGKQNVAIISQNTDYGTGFVRYLDPALSGAGAEVVADVTYDEKGTAFDTEVEQVIASEPDAVALIGYVEDGGKILAEMLKQGVDFGETTVYVTDGMNDNELYKAVDESDPAITENLRGTAPSAAPENGAAFFPDAFAAFAPQVASPIYSAQSYDCVMAIALAAQKTGSDAPFDIASEITNITRGEADDATSCNTAADCIEAATDGGDIDYDGASGALDFSDVGEPSAGSYDVFTFGADGSAAVDEQVVVGT